MKALMSFCLISFFTFNAFAVEEVLIFPPVSKTDKRSQYYDILLTKVLEVTAKEYGEAVLKHGIKMRRDRAYKELLSGDRLHVYPITPKEKWEINLKTIYFPLLKGLLGHRLFLINKDKQHLFDKVKSLTELKNLRAGTGAQWSITKIFDHENFNTIKGNIYDSLFKMLQADRFDYFPRGLNEIYPEFETHKVANQKLAIEDELMLYVPLPVYYFVSPKKPKLAERIKKGLDILRKNGEFDKLFDQYYGKLILKSNLKNRRRFEIPNFMLSDKNPLDKKELWINP